MTSRQHWQSGQLGPINAGLDLRGRKRLKVPLYPPHQPDVNQFLIRSMDNRYVFRATLADGAPLVIDGYGGWSVTQRAKDIGLTEWQGRNPIAIEIPFTLDRWITHVDNPGELVEEQVKMLERLCGLGTHDHPPICRVNGRGVIPHDNYIARNIHRWVIENVTWDRSVELRSGDTQRRVRCGGTITIRQYIEAPTIERRRRVKTNKGRTSYVVKQGDTLLKIAARHDIYGNAKKWKRIGEANNIRDPHKKLKVGRRLKIPR